VFGQEKYDIQQMLVNRQAGIRFLAKNLLVNAESKTLRITETITGIKVNIYYENPE
jgi:hypothetical protein